MTHTTTTYVLDAWIDDKGRLRANHTSPGLAAAIAQLDLVDAGEPVYLTLPRGWTRTDVFVRGRPEDYTLLEWHGPSGQVARWGRACAGCPAEGRVRWVGRVAEDGTVTLVPSTAYSLERASSGALDAEIARQQLVPREVGAVGPIARFLSEAELLVATGVGVGAYGEESGTHGVQLLWGLTSEVAAFRAAIGGAKPVSPIVRAAEADAYARAAEELIDRAVRSTDPIWAVWSVGLASALHARSQDSALSARPAGVKYHGETETGLPWEIGLEEAPPEPVRSGPAGECAYCGEEDVPAGHECGGGR